MLHLKQKTLIFFLLFNCQILLADAEIYCSSEDKDSIECLSDLISQNEPTQEELQAIQIEYDRKLQSYTKQDPRIQPYLSEDKYVLSNNSHKTVKMIPGYEIFYTGEFELFVYPNARRVVMSASGYAKPIGYFTSSKECLKELELRRSQVENLLEDWRDRSKNQDVYGRTPAITYTLKCIEGRYSP